MRIRELYLKAFGPFTEKKITLSAVDGGEGGLCVLYGGNEIGKTSALRALRDLLYGIPHKSSDNFNHDHGKMRVGARMTFSNGEEFDFVRRKSQKDSMLVYPTSGPTSDDRKSGIETPTHNEQFDALIRTIPVHVFENFYGLDHARLEQGSEALLESEGELGQALFSAGLGAGNIRTVLASLGNEADVLFKGGRATKPKINASLSRFDSIKKSIGKQALKPADWKRTQEAVQGIETQLAALESEIEGTQAELVRLTRIQLTLPALARHRLDRKRFSERSASLELPTGFEERLGESRAERTRSRDNLERTTRAIEALEAKLEALPLEPVLIETRESIESRGDQIGAYQENVGQLPRREAEMARLAEGVRSILERIGATDAPTDVAALRVSMSRAPRIRELADRFIECETRLETAQEELERAKIAHAECVTRLADASDPPDSAALERALERARRLGEVDDRLAIQGPRIEAEAEDAERTLDGLGRWSGPLDEIDRMAVPESETINRFSSRFDELKHERRAIVAERKRLTLEHREATEQLSTLRGEGSVPSEADRDAIRLERDQTWHEIRRVWIDRPDPVSSESPSVTPSVANLPERFEAELASADQIADRLRNEAKRVAQEAQLVSGLERIETDIRDLADHETELAERERVAREDWVSIWTSLGISPAEPAEMRAWLERLRNLRDTVVAVRRKRRDWESEQDVRDLARESVSHELVVLGKPGVGKRVDDLVRQGAEVEAELVASRSRAHRLREEHVQAKRTFDDADAFHRKCSAVLDSVAQDLAAAVAGLHLASSPRPRDVHEQLDRLAELFNLMRDRDSMAERIEGMKTNAARFREAVDELVARCAPALPALQGLEPVAAITRLRDRSSSAIRNQSNRAQIESSLEEVREEHAAASQALGVADEAMMGLRREAGATNDDQLDTAVSASMALVQARRALEAEELNLAEMGQGRSIEELETEAKDVDPDALPGRIDLLKSQLQEVTRRKDAAAQESWEQKRSLGEMNGAEDVALLAEEAQAEVAAIGVDARRYVTLILAREILAREVERYRDRNQAPVLERATELFRALTRGAYQAVQSEYGSGEVPELLALQADGTRKRVTALSNGTRDQLFLALRLASLAEAVAGSEPMPFIADDILIEFDEDRSRAALEVLANLAEKNQILLFSHHAHIAEQARGLGSRARVIDL